MKPCLQRMDEAVARTDGRLRGSDGWMKPWLGRMDEAVARTRMDEAVARTRMDSDAYG